MTDRELMQMVLDALEWCYDVTEWPANGKSAQDKAIEALRARLAQPESEQMPTKLMGPNLEGVLNAAGFYKQREWQGLTDEEIKEIIGPWGSLPVDGYTRKLFDQIEAKLKEKNNG